MASSTLRCIDERDHKFARCHKFVFSIMQLAVEQTNEYEFPCVADAPRLAKAMSFLLTDLCVRTMYQHMIDPG